MEQLQKARAAESDLVGGEDLIEGIKKMVTCTLINSYHNILVSLSLNSLVMILLLSSGSINIKETDKCIEINDFFFWKTYLKSTKQI